MKKIISILFAFLISFSVANAKIILKAGHTANPDEPYHIGMLEFKKVVEQETKGEVEIQIFPNGQLGSEKEMIEGLKLGTVDITSPSNGNLTNFVPELGIFDLPFLFRDRAHMYKAMDGAPGKKLSSAMADKGFRLLGFYEAGVRHIMTTSKPINNINDLKGLKIRTMGVPAHVSSFNAFGAKATPMAYGELYGALQQQVVDGAEAANTNYNSKKFYEVAPYWAQIGWTALVADLIMSEEKFKSLPKNVQAALLKAGLASAAVERKAYSDSDNSLLDSLKKQGVKVTYPDPKGFREASKAVYDEFVKTSSSKDILKAIQGM
jgi:tripartite ATP-independent transporter DctP family solute receptor